MEHLQDVGVKLGTRLVVEVARLANITTVELADYFYGDRLTSSKMKIQNSFTIFKTT